MRIGIVTFYNCDNYGAELQAYALQKKLNLMGFDAELINMEKEKHSPSVQTIITAIINRFRQYGFWGGIKSSYILITNKIASRNAYASNRDKFEAKHLIFRDFFNNYIPHSKNYFTLEELRKVKKLPYDVIIAGSDQIWNYMQTKYLDVFFMKFANNWGAKKIAYAASFSVDKIPKSLIRQYKELIENVDVISVRELNAAEIVRSISNKTVEVVLDPTLLLKRSEWVKWISNSNYYPEVDKMVIIYTLSGSHYIYSLAKEIARELNAKVVNIKNGYHRVKGDEGITHLYNVGPREFISLFNRAVYVITDSFHGTAFSINFNIPFTTLLNPVSVINSRALSILEITGLQNRLIYDDGCNKKPSSLVIDFEKVNSIMEGYRSKSMEFLQRNLQMI